MKNNLITAAAMVAFFMLIAAIPAKQIDTKVFINRDAMAIKNTIDLWSKNGWVVQSLTSQDVYGNSYGKGDLILIMTKK